jgi:hypothetical protein
MLMFSEPDELEDQLIGSSESTIVEWGVSLVISSSAKSWGIKKSGPRVNVLHLLKYGERSL